MERVILTTGGTGGHVFPALAVAEELRRRNPDVSILFVGSNYGPEAEMASKASVDFAGLPVRGVMGRGLRAIPAAIGLGRAIFKALALVRKFRPQAVAGFGGYASFAPVLASGILRKPVLLHEQNAIAGSSNRFLSRFASRICVSLPGTAGFAQECVVTGNPIRQYISGASATASRARKNKRLLVLGGSQGARALNRFVTDNLESFTRAGVEILHQCGPKHLEETRAAYEAKGYPTRGLHAFLDNMADAYQWADLALCRAGASTVAELAASATPSVLVPFPAAIHDHQTVNAKILSDSGAAKLIAEKELAGELDVILDLVQDSVALAAMARKALDIARPQAAANLADQLEEIGKK